MLNFLRNLLRGGPKIQRVDIGKRFQLVNRVGQGSMSKVWRAVDLRTSKTVALKVLDFEKTQRLESRFARMKTPKPTEGEVAYTLRHPHIVQTLDYGVTTDGEQFVVMEYVDGVSLDYLVEVQNDVMKRNCLRFCIQLGDAIEYFHKQGWIHRDICPRNVVVDQHHSVKLIDFGLVVPNTEEYRAPGNRTGTAMYMAPELVKRQKTDQRIDIYSYAISCFQMYARVLPWAGGESLETAVQRINVEPKSLKKLVPEIDPIVAKAIMKGLARDPNDRWPTMGKMLEPLKYVLQESGQDAD